MKWNPVGARVLIRPDEAQAQHTDAGIYLPENLREKPLSGTVVAVGNATSIVAVGNRVRYGSYTGTYLKLEDGIEYLIIKEDELLAWSTA